MFCLQFPATPTRVIYQIYHDEKNMTLLGLQQTLQTCTRNTSNCWSATLLKSKPWIVMHELADLHALLLWTRGKILACLSQIDCVHTSNAQSACEPLASGLWRFRTKQDIIHPIKLGCQSLLQHLHLRTKTSVYSGYHFYVWVLHWLLKVPCICSYCSLYFTTTVHKKSHHLPHSRS